MTAGSWSATSRQLTLAWAWAGMIVLEPVALEAAPDAVDVEGRAGRLGARGSSSRPRRRARRRPVAARNASSSKGSARHRACSVVGQLDDLVVEARARGSGRPGP